MIRKTCDDAAAGFLGVVLALAVTACASSAMPPSGPKHVPSDSSETTTECPKERTQAQRAREALLDASSEGLRLQAAERVFAHGQCEAKVASALPAPSGSQDNILTALRAMRDQMQDAINLFREVGRYQAPLFAVRATIAEARAKLHFAELVAAIASPTDLDAKSRTAFESELAEAVRTLQLEARMSLRKALELARTTAGANEQQNEACQLLTTLGTSDATQCP